jgi:hypothetical protein
MENPLTATDIQNARNAIALARELEGEIKKAMACDIPCEDLRERCQNAKARMEKYNETYGIEYRNRR